MAELDRMRAAILRRAGVEDTPEAVRAFIAAGAVYGRPGPEVR